MSSSKVLAGVLVFATLLAGCGFHPMYGKQEGQTSPVELSGIQVNLIPNRVGQQLRNELIAGFAAAGPETAPRYDLALTPVLISEERLGIRADTTATRINLTLSTGAQLLDAKTNKLIYLTTVSTLVSYDLLDSAPYSNVTSRQAAQTQAVEDLARQINLRLAAFFAGGKKPSRDILDGERYSAAIAAGAAARAKQGAAPQSPP